MNNQPNYAARWLAIGLIGFGLWKGSGGKLPLPLPLPLPSPGPAPVEVPAPPADLQAVVGPVSVQAKLVGADAAAAAPLYLSLAKALEADTGALLKTTDSLRQLTVRSGGLLFTAQGWKGKHPAMGQAIDAAFAQALGGTDNKTLDPALRVRAAATWRAIAWALQGGN
jgi:hypothetical protein